MMKRTSRLSVLEEFKDCAEASLDDKTEKSSVGKFVKDVRAGGFEISPNISEATGLMNGFSFSKEGIIFTASRAGKKFKWSNLAESVNYKHEEDTEFLQNLKTEFLVNKEAQEAAGKKAKEADNYSKDALKITTELTQEVTGNETTRQRAFTAKKQPAETVQRAEQTRFGETSGIQAQTTQVENAPRNKPGAGLAETKTVGAESSQIGDNRTDDAAARSGQTTGGNDAKNSSAGEPGEEAHSGSHTEGEHRIKSSEKRTGEPALENRRVESGRGVMQAGGGISEEKNDDGARRIPGISTIRGELQNAGGEGFENTGYDGSRISNQNPQSTENREFQSKSAEFENERSDRFFSEADRRIEIGGSLERKIEDENIRKIAESVSVVNSSTDNIDDHNDGVFPDSQRFERGAGAGKENLGGFEISNAAVNDGNRDTAAANGEHNFDAAANLTPSRQLLQNDTRGSAKENYSGERQPDRRAAAAAAQVINVKHFDGQLNPQIVTEWTTIIEKSGADAFLDEMLKPAGEAGRQKVFNNICRQSAIIAENLELPPPVPQLTIDLQRMTTALTSIEIANFEAANGGQIGEKTFEILAARNAPRAAAPPSSEQLETIRDEFGSAADNLNLSSNLEAETLAALLDTARVGFDAEEAAKIRGYVAVNEASARETATLVQIAYGGQKTRFTDEFKADLAEQIYYAPTPAAVTYQQFRQFDWQMTVGNFKPLVDNLAEQHKIEIKMPGNDDERNKMLAEFAGRQLIDAAAQNKPMEPYVQTNLLQSLINSGNHDVSRGQQETIAGVVEGNLEPPEFSKHLEATAYNLIKYDDDKKAEMAVTSAETIRHHVRAQEERLAQIEAHEEGNILRMR